MRTRDPPRREHRRHDTQADASQALRQRCERRRRAWRRARATRRRYTGPRATAPRRFPRPSRPDLLGPEMETTNRVPTPRGDRRARAATVAVTPATPVRVGRLVERVTSSSHARRSPGPSGTSTACSSSASSGTISSARSCVDARTTNAAAPSSWARSQLAAVTHHRSPGRVLGTRTAASASRGRCRSIAGVRGTQPSPPHRSCDSRSLPGPTCNTRRVRSR